jgi:YHS domain-containing protein
MTQTTNDTEAPSRPAPMRRRKGALAWGVRIIVVRLRFLIVLLVALGVISQWNALTNRWDWLVNSILRRGPEGTGATISSDTEYFCPMDPGVISDWPTKCSICNMALVRRRKGEAVQLPDGVVARMQLSPYRVQLAGIRTSPLGYRPLARDIVAEGVVERSATVDKPAPLVVEVEIHEREIPFVAPGQAVELTNEAFAGRDPWKGVVESVKPDVSPVRHTTIARVAVEAPNDELWPGMRVRARLQSPVAEIEPFRSQPSDPPPVSSADPRRVFVCPDHPQVLNLQAGRCPHDKNHLEEIPLADHQRIGWWCPMHPKVTAGEADHECDECGGMKLLARVVNYRPRGEVLAVPETALIDTGDRKLVYVESMPGMFDGVEVEVGARCGEFFPVIRGIEAGQRVATNGAFLIDAETRLNPSLAAAYFGAARGSISGGRSRDTSVPAPPTDDDADEVRKALAELSPVDRAAALRQKTCPVTGLPLGSMGPPPRVVVNGKTVFICCEGCAATLEENPEKYLTTKP